MSRCGLSSSWQSPFHHQLNTNYVPSDDEIDQIRAHLMPYEAERTRLDSLIDDIEEFTVQKNRLDDYIEPHKALVSCARRLPQDVVEEVFLACLPVHNDAVMNVTEAPLLLGRISSAWRSIAFAMPRLWASLHVSAHSVAGSKARTAAAVHWLQRSAPFTLSISVSYNGAYWHNYGALIELIVPFSTRWHALHLSRMQQDDFFQLAGASAPLLADVTIAFQPEVDPENGSRVLSSNLFRGVNSQRVTIISCKLGNLVPSAPFGWDHLTHLTLQHHHSTRDRGLDCATALRLIDGCSHLISLRLCLHWSGPSGGSFMKPILASSLESLIVDTDRPVHPAILENFVDWLVMPRLKRVHLVHGNSSINFPITSAMSLERLGQRSPLISDLRLNLSNFTQDDLVHIFQPWSQLTKLNMRVSYNRRYPYNMRRVNAKELLTALTPDPLAPSLCPSLQELVTESDWIEDVILVYFLQAHLNHGTNLRRFQLNFQCERPDIAHDIGHFLERGLEISLSYKAVDETRKSAPWEGIER
ncbi:hypothetical protein DFH06DRAFT_1477024 [Mycena polygramma]|nr:hypothetical protein DFH06DRAFT_1477024 [Mycena polygramma]